MSLYHLKSFSDFLLYLLSSPKPLLWLILPLLTGVGSSSTSDPLNLNSPLTAWTCPVCYALAASTSNPLPLDILHSLQISVQMLLCQTDAPWASSMLKSSHHKHTASLSVHLLLLIPLHLSSPSLHGIDLFIYGLSISTGRSIPEDQGLCLA